MSRVTTAESALQAGNSLFVDENYEQALEHYTEAIDLDDSPNAETFIKRSTCYYKLDKFTEALQDANKAIQVQPNNAKAYLRKGMSLFAVDEYEAALAAFEKGLSLDSSNTQLKTWVRKCQSELKLDATTTTTAPTPTPNNSEHKMDVTPTSTSTSTTTTNNPVPQPVQAPVQAKPEPKFIHDWYQTTTHVVITLLAKGITKDIATVDIQEQSLCVTIKLAEGKHFQLDVELFDRVVPSESTAMFLSTKVEIKLKKATSARWNSLEDNGQKKVAQFEVNKAPITEPKSKNWDKIVDEATKNDKAEGEEALNKVFQDIFSNGNDEQKRAMMKSFTESGGTVLSTNWDEVGKSKVKGSPPQGLEMHNWDELTKEH